jgi:Domain of unknown function (DUF4177)
MGETWEYKVVAVTASEDASADSAELSAHGSAGWELVTLTADPHATSSASFRAVFKKRTA